MPPPVTTLDNAYLQALLGVRAAQKQGNKVVTPNPAAWKAGSAPMVARQNLLNVAAKPLPPVVQSPLALPAPNPAAQQPQFGQIVNPTPVRRRTVGSFRDTLRSQGVATPRQRPVLALPSSGEYAFADQKFGDANVRVSKMADDAVRKSTLRGGVGGLQMWQPDWQFGTGAGRTAGAAAAGAGARAGSAGAVNAASRPLWQYLAGGKTADAADAADGKKGLLNQLFKGKNVKDVGKIAKFGRVAGPAIAGIGADALISNVMPDTRGRNVLSGVSKGAGIGAGLGSVVPGVGTAVGAVGGGVIGGLIGATQSTGSERIQTVLDKVGDTLPQLGLSTDAQQQLLGQLELGLALGYDEEQLQANIPDLLSAALAQDAQDEAAASEQEQSLIRVLALQDAAESFAGPHIQENIESAERYAEMLESQADKLGQYGPAAKKSAARARKDAKERAAVMAQQAISLPLMLQLEQEMKENAALQAQMQQAQQAQLMQNDLASVLGN